MLKPAPVPLLVLVFYSSLQMLVDGWAREGCLTTEALFENTDNFLRCRKEARSVLMFHFCLESI